MSMYAYNDIAISTDTTSIAIATLADVHKIMHMHSYEV